MSIIQKLMLPQRKSAMTLIIINLLVIINLFSCQQGQEKDIGTNERIFTMEELGKDFDETINAMQAHPRLYRFTNRTDFEELIRQQRDLINGDLSVEEFFCILKPVLTRIGCCHSTIRMPEGFWASYNGLLFPVQMLFTPSGVLVSKSYSGDNIIPPGSEILSINGISMDVILSQLKPLISADAFNEGHIRYRLNMRFPFLFALKYGAFEQFEVEYTEPSTKAVTYKSVDAIGPVPYFSEPFGRYAPFAEPVKLNENRYSGDLLTITDGGNVSTSGHFCALLKYHGIGKLVGSETGATYTCNDASKTTVLKNTGLQVNIPRRTFAAAVYNMPDDRGVLPDFPVETSVNDLITGVDGIMEYTIGLYGIQ